MTATDWPGKKRNERRFRHGTGTQSIPLNIKHWKRVYFHSRALRIYFLTIEIEFEFECLKFANSNGIRRSKIKTGIVPKFSILHVPLTMSKKHVSTFLKI